MTFYIKESHFLFLLNSQTLVPDLIIYHWLHHVQLSMHIVFHFLSTFPSFGTRYLWKSYRSLNQLPSGWHFAVPSQLIYYICGFCFVLVVCCCLLYGYSVIVFVVCYTCTYVCKGEHICRLCLLCNPCL